MRRSIDLALAADPQLGAGQLRVLLVLLAEIPSWSRVLDKVAYARIAERAQVSKRHVGRSLKRLAACGAIAIRPGQGAGRLSVIELPTEENPTLLGLLSGDKGAGQKATIGGPLSKSTSSDEKADATDPANQTYRGPTYEKVPEKSSEEGRRLRRLQTLARNRARGVPDLAEDEIRSELLAELRRDGGSTNTQLVEAAVDHWRRERMTTHRGHREQVAP